MDYLFYGFIYILLIFMGLCPFVLSSHLDDIENDM